MSGAAILLRHATAEAHQRLENCLNLLAQPACEARFRWVLGRFWGFHAVWEPALQAQIDLAEIVAGRVRLALLGADLAWLGLLPEQCQALPRCTEADRLCSTREAALGSLYVMEGSTLGGKVIARHLAAAAWAPAEGLRYFNPHGDATGRMWRKLQSDLEAAAAKGGAVAITAGAVAAFDLLTEWLGEPDPAARHYSRPAGSADDVRPAAAVS